MDKELEIQFNALHDHLNALDRRFDKIDSKLFVLHNKIHDMMWMVKLEERVTALEERDGQAPT